jgi:alanine dehydrogenase
MALASKGWRKALAENEHLLRGLNICEGRLTNDEVAAAFGRKATAPAELLAA